VEYIPNCGIPSTANADKRSWHSNNSEAAGSAFALPIGALGAELTVTRVNTDKPKTNN
jgi:hypothetical protein